MNKTSTKEKKKVVEEKQRKKRLNIDMRRKPRKRNLKKERKC
jgi:hypothetical protein